MIKMHKEKIIDELISYFMCEDTRFSEYEIPKDLQEKRLFLRGIINLRLPYPLKEEIISLEDDLLQLELKEKSITDVEDINLTEDKICLWLGDITTLKIDAIVNACNSSLLGCFIPNHSCIDNAIHTYAGIRLRLACNDIMKGTEEEIGKAKITKAFNLPSNYVIHTVGPIVNNILTEKEIKELENCYISCLNVARENNIRTIAFPSISTGVFHFPKSKASQVAVSTIRNYLKKYPTSFDKIVINVFTKEDKDYYDRLFQNKEAY